MYRDVEGIYHRQVLRFSNPNHVASGPHGGEFAKGHGGAAPAGGSEHPVAAMARKIDADPKVKAAVAANAARGDHRGDPGVTVNREYTPEAVALHKEIVGKFLTPDTVAKSGTKPVVVIMLGRPGAGKSTIAAGLTGFPKMAQINSDLVMEHLPGYEPHLSSAYHGRATNIAQHDLMPAALAGRHNLNFDTTGRDPGFAKEIGEMFVKHGYEVHVVHVQTKAEVAVQRGYDRFKAGGRFIPTKFLTDPGMGPGTRASYKVLKQVAKSWKQYENSGPTAKLIDSGG